MGPSVSPQFSQMSQQRSSSQMHGRRRCVLVGALQQFVDRLGLRPQACPNFGLPSQAVSQRPTQQVRAGPKGTAVAGEEQSRLQIAASLKARQIDRHVAFGRRDQNRADAGYEIGGQEDGTPFFPESDVTGRVPGGMQHGQLDLRVAKLSDVKLIANARTAAQDFLDKSESLLQYKELAAQVARLRTVTNLN